MASKSSWGDIATKGLLIGGVLATSALASYWFKCSQRPKSSKPTCVERFVKCMSPEGFHKISYMEWGDPQNSKVAICVHGLTRNKRDFDALAKLLVSEGGYRVIAIDVVGRGNSDYLNNKNLYGYPQYLNDISTVIAHVVRQSDTASPLEIDYVGMSMGGLIGMILAGIPGNPIRRLVMVDVGPLVPAAASQRLATYVGNDPQFNSLEQAEAYLKQNYSAHFGPSVDAAYWTHIAQHGFKFNDTTKKYHLKYDPGIAVPFRAFAQMDMDVNLWAQWKKIMVPILVLRGKNSDILTEEVTDQMLDMSSDSTGPHVSVIVYPNTGHLPPLYADDRVDVLNWLAAAAPAPAESSPTL